MHLLPPTNTHPKPQKEEEKEKGAFLRNSLGHASYEDEERGCKRSEMQAD